MKRWAALYTRTAAWDKSPTQQLLKTAVVCGASAVGDDGVCGRWRFNRC
jgi:hypothetical protein